MAKATEKFSVLVVTGNEPERQAMVDCLAKAWPFEHEMVLDCSANIVEALEKLLINRYTLIVVDWDARADGGKFLQQMRLRGVSRPSVVFCTLRRDQIAEDVEAWGAVWVHKAELNTTSFHDAVAESLQRLHSGQVSIARPPLRPRSPFL